MKECTKCHVEKERDDFYANRKAKDGLYSWCKDCHRELCSMRWKSRRGPRGNWHESDVRKLHAAQGGRCPICTKEFGDGRIPHLDHDHETSRVRGLLCQQCNRALGLLRDDVQALRNAASYVELGGLPAAYRIEAAVEARKIFS
jgi:Recombination endonuclease VII